MGTQLSLAITWEREVSRQGRAYRGRYADGTPWMVVRWLRDGVAVGTVEVIG